MTSNKSSSIAELADNVCKWDVTYLESSSQVMVTTRQDNQSCFAASTRDSKWQLKVSPSCKPQCNENTPSLTLYLQSCKYSSKKVNVRCNISLKIGNKSSYFEKEVNRNAVSVGDEVVLCRYKDIQDIQNVHQNMLLIKCVLETQEWKGEPASDDRSSLEQFHTVTEPVFGSNATGGEAASSPSAGLLGDLAKLLRGQKFGDVYLVVNNQRLLVYKGILAVRSPKFAEMFQQAEDFNKKNTIEIDDVDFEVLKEIIMFLYTGDIPKLSTMARRLFPAADTYELPELKKMCEEEICRNMSVESVAMDLLLAMNYDSELLRETAVEFLKQNKKAVMATKGWKTLQREHQHILAEIIFEMLD